MAGRRVPVIKVLVSKGLADDETVAASLIDSGVVQHGFSFAADEDIRISGSTARHGCLSA